MTYTPSCIPRKHIQTEDERNLIATMLTGIRKIRERVTGTTTNTTQGEADRDVISA